MRKLLFISILIGICLLANCTHSPTSNKYQHRKWNSFVVLSGGEAVVYSAETVCLENDDIYFYLNRYPSECGSIELELIAIGDEKNQTIESESGLFG